MTDADLTPTGLPKQRVVREWQHNGRDCRIKICCILHTRHYCGYARTSLTADYNEQPLCEIDVHGGLTYGVDKDGWLGFDCGHALDRCVDEDGAALSGAVPDAPGLGNRPADRTLLTTWTPDDVAAEVESLAEQLDDLENDG